MDINLLKDAATQAGVTEQALIDAAARGQAYFGEKELTPEALAAWTLALKTEAPHLWPPASPSGPGAEALPAWLSPVERLTRSRAGQPLPGRQKPGRYIATDAELQALASKSLTEQLTIAHERAQQP